MMVLLIFVVIGVTIPVEPGESIQNALDSSVFGDTVLVMPGIHSGTGTNLVQINGSHNGVVLTGNVENPYSTVLSGVELTGSIITVNGQSSGAIDSTTVISGLRFTGGNAVSEPFGGALYLEHASPLIEHCLFIGNRADNGGAAYFWKGAPVVRFCLFEDNECLSAGGAVYLYSSDGEISYCRFEDNTSWDDGGGLFMYHCSPAVFNCLFTGGYAHDDGAGIYCYALSSPEISFCTFYGNESQNTGSAVYFRVNSSPRVNHCIATENAGPAFYIQDGGEPVFSYNCVWGNPDGNYGNLADPTGTGGNISLDPLLAGDMYLSHTASGQPATSPCVDAGRGFSTDYGLEFTWTRNDSVPDSSIVDLGFHHGPYGSFQSAPEPENFCGFTVSPNPAVSMFSLDYSPEQGWNKLEVFDLSGRVILTETPNSSGRHTICSSSLGARGVYIARLSADGICAAVLFTVIGND